MAADYMYYVELKSRYLSNPWQSFGTKKKIIDTCMSIQYACMFTIYYTGMCIIPIISFYVEEWDVPNKYLDYYIINIIIQDVYK